MIKFSFLKRLSDLGQKVGGYNSSKAKASSTFSSGFSQTSFNYGPQGANSRIKHLQVGGGSLAFFPGATLILLGMAVLFAPRLVLAIAATFFITVGCVALFIVWKFMKLKKQVTEAFGKASRGFAVQKFSSLSDFRFPRDEADPEDDIEDAEFVEEIGPKGKKTTIVIH